MEDQSKNPFIDQKTGKQTVGPFDYGHNPPIHKLKSGHRYPNNILDREGEEKNQYLKLIPYAWDLIDYRTLNNPIFKDLNYLLTKNFDRKIRKSYEN